MQSPQSAAFSQGCPGHRTLRRSGRGLIAILLVAMAGAFADGQIGGLQLPQAPPVRGQEGEGFQGLFLATDRAASRGLRLARERIEAGEYAQAVRFLDKLLADSEDSFIDTKTGRGRLRGLKSAAQETIGALPPEGRQAYLLECEARAKNALLAAVKAGDLTAVRRVARRYLHTPAGFQATMILARNEHDHGRSASAAALYQQLVETDAAAREYGHQLFVLTAVEWLHAGREGNAKQVLELLRSDFPQSKLVVAGQEYDFSVGRTEDALLWLQSHAGHVPVHGTDLADAWTLFRGGPARNAPADGGMPHMNLRWRVPLANDHRVERVLKDVRRAHERHGAAMLPAAHPLAVGDYLVTRTPRGLMGIQMSTGKRIWTVRPDDAKEYERLAEAVRVPNGGFHAPHLLYALEQRIWADTLYGQLSSDGERVYAVRGLGLIAEQAVNPFQFRPFPVRQGGRQQKDADLTATNTLSAFELKTEGKRVWEINGAEVDGPLAGAFFLGPPLPVDGRLHALVEIKSGIHLAAIESTDQWPYWRLAWIQQLANLEIGIRGHRQRRYTGVSPSFDDGVLVCPTSAGAVVAVDLLQRSLLWAYRYPARLPVGAHDPRALVRRMQQSNRESEDTWADGSATIAAGRVLLTPVESDQLHCLDLRTGERLWKRPRAKALYLACVEKEKIVLVGPEEVAAVRLEDGEPAWEESLTFPGVMPTGRGFYSDGQYFLPISGGEVVAIDVAAGKITARAKSRSGEALGNLICHHGAVVSQSERFVDVFDQLDVLTQRIHDTLADNPDDPDALRSLAEITYGDGDLETAIAHLRKAYEQAPHDPAVVDLLVMCLLEAVETDYDAHRDDLPLLESLATGADRRWRLARVRSEGLERSGNYVDAARIYLGLAAEDQRSAQTDEVSADWSTPRYRWIRAQLADLRKKASADGPAIDELVRPLEEALGEDPSIGRLQQHLDYFADIGRGEQLQRVMAAKLIDLGALLRSELLLLHLAESDDETMRATAHAMLAELLHGVGRHRAAGRHDEQLARQYSRVVCARGLTGREVAAAHAAEYANAAAAKQWPYGAITQQVKPIRNTSSGRYAQERYQGMRLEGTADPVLEGYICFVDQQPRRSARGAFILQNPLGRDEISVPLLVSDMGVRAVDLRGRRCHAVARGGIVVASFGKYVIAVDALTAGGDPDQRVLWTAAVNDGLIESPFPSVYRRSRRASSFAEFGQPGRWFATGDDGLPVGVLGPITQHGVAFQTGGRLKSVDPLTGRTNWERDDVPAGCLLFGDDEFLFALPPKAKTAIVFRTLDGRRIGERSTPPIAQHVATSGRSVLCWKKQANEDGAKGETPLELVLYDVWGEGPIWSREYASGSKHALADNTFVGVVEPSGRFELVAIENGSVAIDQPVEKEPRLAGAHVLLARDHVVLVTNQTTNATQSGTLVYPVLDTDYPVISGHVYTFDRVTGAPRWPLPAKVRRQGLALWQPRELPILAFASQANRTEKGAVEVLCLSRADGRAVFHNNQLKRTYGRCRIMSDIDRDANDITIALSVEEIRLSMTNKPIAPSPPFDHDVEVSPTKSRRGLLRILRGM